MSGTLIYLMGPSGSGKDSLINAARPYLAERGCDVMRRVITRSAESVGEEAVGVSPEAFESLKQQGAFALHWQANGLGYGVRHAQLAPLAQGHWVLLNGSRAYLPEALARFPNLVAVHITASPQVLRERLLSRGRETREEVEARVQRALAYTPPPDAASLEVHNDGTLGDAGQRLLSVLEDLPGWPRRNVKRSGKLSPIAPILSSTP